MGLYFRGNEVYTHTHLASSISGNYFRERKIKKGLISFIITVPFRHSTLLFWAKFLWQANKVQPRSSVNRQSGANLGVSVRNSAEVAVVGHAQNHMEGCYTRMHTRPSRVHRGIIMRRGQFRGTGQNKKKYVWSSEVTHAEQFPLDVRRWTFRGCV